MRTMNKTLDVASNEVSTTTETLSDNPEIFNERAVDVNDEEPKTKKSDLKESKTDNNQLKDVRNPNHTRNEVESNQLTSTGTIIKEFSLNNGRVSPKTGHEFYVIPLDTPTAYQNHVGSVFDPSVTIKPSDLTFRQRFRFLICSLAIFSFSLCLANRMALNIAINEMAQGNTTQSDATLEQSHNKGIIRMGEHIEHVDHDVHLVNKHQQVSKLKVPVKLVKYEHVTPSAIDTTTTSPQREAIGVTEVPKPAPENRWDSTKQHILMGAFYCGYFPVMLVSGYLAELYGAKTALFLASFGSGIINILTPIIVDWPIIVLFIARVMLGALQAPIVPALYALCNMWLSKTEMGIFASFIKVSMGLGVLFGYLIPGLHMMIFQCNWSIYFYTEGVICLIWSLTWFLLATSKPQDNKFVQLQELRWILRKKPSEIVPITGVNLSQNGIGSIGSDDSDSSEEKPKPKPDRSIISQIIRHRPVWALAFTKLTHNIGIDFVLIEFPSFMKATKDAELQTIIVIACIGSFTLVVMVSFIGWLSKVVVQKSLFGWTKTIWRKVFQGIANLGIASMFFIMAIFEPNDLFVICFIVIMLFIFYMFGAGGEAVAANDMSIMYPATIYGFAHSISALGGIMVPGLAALVVGNESKSYERWTIYFTILGILSTLGGLSFILVFKSKLFLPNEINPDKTTNITGGPQSNSRLGTKITNKK